MKKKYSLLIFIILIFFVVRLENLFSEDKMSEKNIPYGQWFAWKYESTSDSEQRKAITYFREMGKLVATVTNTRNKTKECEWGDLNPEKAYKISIQSIETATQIDPPPLCKKHYDLSLQILGSVASYQKIRADLGDEKISAKIKEDQQFEEKMRSEQLEEFRLRTEVSNEFYRVLRKTGFYDNALNEMLDLKLITPEQKIEFEKLNKEDEK